MENVNPTAATARRALRFLRQKPALKETPPDTVPQEVAMPGFVRRQCMLYGYTEGLLAMVKIAIAVCALVGAALFVAILGLSHRPMIRVNAPPTLKVMDEAYFQVEGLRFDQVATSIISILTLKHHVDDGGAPYFTLLQGMVSQQIYHNTELSLKKAIAEIRTKRIVQNLNITKIGDFESDPKAQRVSCYVRGYFMVNGQEDSRAVAVPYRAEVLLEKTTVGNLNPLPYTMIGCTERINDAAIAWDTQHSNGATAAQKAEIHGH